MTTKRPPGRPKKEVKPRQFSIRLYEKELAMLESLALLYGVSLSTAIAICVERVWDNVSPAQRRALANLKQAREAARSAT